MRDTMSAASTITRAITRRQVIGPGDALPCLLIVLITTALFAVRFLTFSSIDVQKPLKLKF